MRKRELSDSEWNSVRKLRETGASWSKIQRETGVPRRKAKQIYEAWERTQSMPDLKEARKQVAAEAFHKHIDSLLQIAQYVASSLRIPQTPNDLATADEYLQSLWQIDIFNKNWPHVSENKEYELKSVNYTNELLFQSLEHHTQTTNIWKVFRQWKEAHNSCVRASRDLQETVRTLVVKNLQKEFRLRARLKQACRKYDPVIRITDAVVWAMWKQTVDPANANCDDEIVSVVSRGNRYEVIFALSNYPSKFSNRVVFSFKDESLAKEAARVCNQSYSSLLKDKDNEGRTQIEALQEKVSHLRDMIDNLARMMHPLLLKPVILRSTCELCPA